MSEIKPFIAGNWKMNGSLSNAVKLVSELDEKYKTLPETKPFDLVVCPPATLISTVKNALANSGIFVGAQDVSLNLPGAHTGDLSTDLLKDVGAEYVIIGHSERRTNHQESNPECKAKAERAIADNMKVILCIGETEAEKDAGLTLDVLNKELSESFPEKASSDNLVIAYEPIWAIGTGKTPTAKDIETVHANIRETLTVLMGIDAAAKMRILYGGSVKPDNAAEILHIKNVNGALVGGASLKAADFWAIATASINKQR